MKNIPSLNFLSVMTKMNPFAGNSINTVKPVYNNHPWDPKIVAVVDSWSLFRGSFMLYKSLKRDLKCWPL